jgi:ParD-like antitoxin of type II bacterial toxin-antitoxin system
MSSDIKPLVVKLSDKDVIRDLKHEARIADRSMAGQIEHWVKLGKAVEAALGSSEIRAVKENSRAFSQGTTGKGMLEKILSSLNQLIISPDRTSVKAGIMAAGVPVYQSDPARSGRIIKINPDGSRVSGNIRNGSFVPAETRRRKAS